MGRETFHREGWGKLQVGSAHYTTHFRRRAIRGVEERGMNHTTGWGSRAEQEGAVNTEHKEQNTTQTGMEQTQTSKSLKTSWVNTGVTVYKRHNTLTEGRNTHRTNTHTCGVRQGTTPGSLHYFIQP